MSLKNKIIKMLGGYTFDYIAKMAAEVVSIREELNSISIASAPTEDVEEVKHGQWVDLGDSEMCSVCTVTKLKEFDALYGKAIWARSKYCSNCGAKMDL